MISNFRLGFESVSDHGISTNYIKRSRVRVGAKLHLTIWIRIRGFKKTFFLYLWYIFVKGTRWVVGMAESC